VPRSTLLRILIAVQLLGAGYLAGCGGNEATAPAAVRDFSGTWDLDFTVAAKACPNRPVGTTGIGRMSLAQQGAAITLTLAGGTATGNVTGSTARLSIAGGNSSQDWEFTLNEAGDRISGTVITDFGAPDNCTETVDFSGVKVDPSAFTVTASNPANGSTGVSLVTAVEVTFNGNVDPSSVSEATFQLVRNGVSVAATRTSDGATIRLVPVNPLASSASYAVNVGADLMSTSGARLGFVFVAGFSTTSQVLDIASAVPADGAVNVAVDGVITVNFNGTLDAATVTPSSFQLRDGNGQDVGGELSVSGAVLTFDPLYSAWLADDTSFTITLTAAIRDQAGRPLAGGRTLGFRTAPLMHLVSSTPANGATLVRIEDALTMVFEFPVDPATVNSSSVTVTADTWVNNQYQPTITGSLSVSDRTVTFTPTGGVWQEYETGYRVWLTGTIRGTGNQRLDGNPTFSFRTIFFDQAFAYRIFVEGLDGERHLQVYSNYWSLMQSSLTESSYWQFIRLGDWGWAIRNLWPETAGKYFDAMDGVQSMRLVDTPPSGGVYTGQTWTPARYNNRGGRQGPQESPGNYYLSSQTFGTDEVLTAKFVDARQQWECFLETRQALVHQLWYFRRDYKL